MKPNNYSNNYHIASAASMETKDTVPEQTSGVNCTDDSRLARRKVSLVDSKFLVVPVPELPQIVTLPPNTPDSPTPSTSTSPTSPPSFSKPCFYLSDNDQISIVSSPKIVNSTIFDTPPRPYLRGDSVLFSEDGTMRLISDATSIRSITSLGFGCTDGKKLIIKSVPASPTDLLRPPAYTPPNDRFDVESFDYYIDDTDSLKPRRTHWENKMQFVLACIGYSVGLGNVWRFPYLCFKSGGGIFLIPYFTILFICGIPLLFMELAIGQYTGRGPIGAIGQICPLLKGTGLASVVISFFMSTYYSVIIAYAIYYFFTSFRADLPWMQCSIRWATSDCWNPDVMLKSNISRPALSRAATEEFFENKVLRISDGIQHPGAMRWELIACLVCAWILVYFALWKSIKSSSQSRVVVATLPFILVIVFLGRALTLEGADIGLKYFFKPDWSRLNDINVWINAASQVLNSLGLAYGSMISFASYNKYNNNMLHDTLAVSFVNGVTSVLVGIFAFATLGNIAVEQSTSVDKVISDSPGFIFVVYTQALGKMPAPQMWSVIFFFTLLCLGLNSQFALVEVVVTSIQDGYSQWIRRKLVYHELLVLVVCLVSLLLGIPNVLQSGVYVFQLMDHYVAGIGLIMVAFFETIAVGWVCGVERLSKGIKQMTGKKPSLYYRSCWGFFIPCFLFILFVFSVSNYKPITYHNGLYHYPSWAHGIGWSLVSIALTCIPCYAIIMLAKADGSSVKERFKTTLLPHIYECKICGEHYCDHLEDAVHYVLQMREQEMLSLVPDSPLPQIVVVDKDKKEKKSKEDIVKEKEDEIKRASS